MSPLVREILLNGLLLAPRLRVRPQTKAGLCLFALAGLFGLIAVIFAVYAGFLAFADSYTPVQAATYMTAIMVALAAISAITAILLTQRHKRHAAIDAEHLTGIVQNVLGALEEELGVPVQESPKTALAIAGILGLWAGKHLR